MDELWNKRSAGVGNEMEMNSVLWPLEKGLGNFHVFHLDVSGKTLVCFLFGFSLKMSVQSELEIRLQLSADDFPTWSEKSCWSIFHLNYKRKIRSIRRKTVNFYALCINSSWKYDNTQIREPVLFHSSYSCQSSMRSIYYLSESSYRPSSWRSRHLYPTCIICSHHEMFPQLVTCRSSCSW